MAAPRVERLGIVVHHHGHRADAHLAETLERVVRLLDALPLVHEGGGEILHAHPERAAAGVAHDVSHPTTLTLTNRIRTRAGLSAYTSLTEAEFYNERGREMFQESLRRTDQIRFGTWGDAWEFKPAHNDAFKDIMPIPLDQINASSGVGKLSQNIGY